MSAAAGRADFKLKVVLEVLKEKDTLATISKRYGGPPLRDVYLKAYADGWQLETGLQVYSEFYNPHYFVGSVTRASFSGNLTSSVDRVFILLPGLLSTRLRKETM